MIPVALAFAMSLIAAVALGQPLLEWLRTSGVRQNVSADAPERHSQKQGTPTMGGVIMLAGVAVGGGTIGIAYGVSVAGISVLLLIAAFGAIGALDDRMSLRRGANLGLRARDKFILQIVLAAAFVAAIARWVSPDHDTAVGGVQLGVWYWPLAVVLIAGLSNATNLADGLDGLTAGCSAISFAGMALMSLTMAGPQSLALVAAAMAGACLGLLWFGAYPAQVFMGDTGSLALGAGLAGVALLGKIELPVLVATLPFWAETLSVMAQVMVFKWRKRKYGIEYAKSHRLFLRAPLHHHFEEAGHPETRIVARFWVAAALCTALALAVR